MTTPLLDRMAEALRKRIGSGFLNTIDVEYRELLSEYDATRPQPGIPPEGDKGEFVLVPREIPERYRGAMLGIFAEFVGKLTGLLPPNDANVFPPEWNGYLDRLVRDSYAAMLAAAPSPAVAQFAPQGEAVRALVADWRNWPYKRRSTAARTAERTRAMAETFKMCADELEAALSRELAGQGREPTE